MKPKTLILMVVAVVCGLGASYMTSKLLAERNETPAEVAPVEKVTLLVAKKNINMHTAMKNKPEDFFKEKEFIKDDAPKDALTKEDLGKLKLKFMKRSLRKDDHITVDDLLDNNFGLKTLPAGKLAVGIRVNVEQIAGGFASLPGSHVDIVWTTRGNNDPFAKILLEDVIVLAADSASIVNENGGAMPASVVTVALTQEEALKVTLAASNGELRLLLRNMDDKSTGDKERLSMTELLKGKAEKPKEVVEEPAPSFRHEYGRGQKFDEPETTPESKQLPKLKKQTVIVRNGTDVQLQHYWVDEQDNLITNPQQYLDQIDQQPTPPPADKKAKKASTGGA
jgi:pilus assembly protein CpaB